MSDSNFICSSNNLSKITTYKKGKGVLVRKMPIKFEVNCFILYWLVNYSDGKVNEVILMYV